MIELVQGKGVGAGKTFYVVQRVLVKLAKGGTVCASSTFQLNWEECCKYVAKRWGVELEPDQYRPFDADDTWRLHTITPPGTPDNQVLVVVDEAQNYLNARDFADREKRPFFKWLTQSRHDDTDVIFITQHAANVDSQIRRLLTYEVLVTNMWNVTVPGLGPWPRTPEWLWKRFKVDIFEGTGKVRMDREWYANEPAAFACYESKSMRLASARGGEPVAKKQLKKAKPKTDLVSLTKRPLLWFAVACLAFSGWRMYGFFYGDKQKKEPTKAEAAAAEKPGEVSVPGQLGEAAKKVVGVNGSEPAAVKPAYELQRETFRGGDGRRFLHTDGGQYRFGELCRLGFVQQVRERSALIRTPSGGTLYIVAEDSTDIPVAAAARSSTVAEAPKEWKPHPAGHQGVAYDYRKP